MDWQVLIFLIFFLCFSKKGSCMHVCRPNKVGYPLKVDRGLVFFSLFTWSAGRVVALASCVSVLDSECWYSTVLVRYWSSKAGYSS